MKPLSRFRGGLWPLLLPGLVLADPFLAAQGTQTCSITGTVVNLAGEPLPATRIRLTSPSLQGERILAADAKGRFAARLLPPGTYDIDVSHEGYLALKTREHIGIDQNFQPRFTLLLAPYAVVEVVAATPALDKTDVKTATNFDLDAVDLLPQGRSQDSVATLAPGVVRGVGGRTQVRGAMTSGNLYLLDGQNIADNAYQTPGVSIIDDAVEETQVLTGALPAEYGNVDGGVINSITRSGSNTFTGLVRYVFTNPSWNAVRPFYDRSRIPDRTDLTRTYTLGGYLLKDRLWFYAAFFRTHASAVENLAGDTLTPDLAYTATERQDRFQGKLTFLLNQDHTLVASYLDSTSDQGNRNYGAGDLLSLVGQHNEDGLASIALRSVWGRALTTELRLGRKTQLLNGGSARSDAYPFINDADDYRYFNGPFNKNDGGDHRDNKSLAAKGTLFWDGAGTHQTDFGLEWLRETRQARNEQSPKDDTLIEASSIPNYSGGLVSPLAAFVFTSSGSTADNATRSLYLNDKWSLDNHFSFQLGLRGDWYSAHSDTGRRTVAARGLSPRLGLKWDLRGDSAWILGLSWARYNSGVAEGITDQVSNAGNPTEIHYNYSGPAFAPAAGIPLAQASDMANYARVPSNVSYYSDPSLNVRLSQDLRAPHADEAQASAAYSFRTEAAGEGFVRLTAVWKTWHDLFDSRVGDDGTVNDAYGSPHFIRVWANSPLAQRAYRDLELDAQTRKGPFQAGGNITWARLEGNDQGEESSSPFTGAGLQYYTSVGGKPMYDSRLTTPYGRLAGDTPLRIRATASYTWEHHLGKTTLGLVYRFDSGSHYSLTRAIKPQGLNPALPMEFGTSATQFYGLARGQFVRPSQAYLDLSLTQTARIAQVRGTPVDLFTKAAFTNVFNHQQVTGFNTKMQPYDGTNAADAPWVPTPAFGDSNRAAYRGTPRQLELQAGLRF